MKRLPAFFLHLVAAPALPSALAGAPATGSYLKQPTRSSCGFIQPVEQQFEIVLGLAREADDEGRAQREVGADLAPACDALAASSPERPGASCASSTSRAGVLERDVEIGQHLALGHQRR